MTAPVTRRRRWPWILLGLLVVLVAAGWFALTRVDAFLLAKVRAEADVYAQRLGRPITVASLDTRLFPRVGATVEGVEVGPAEGEELPLLKLGRLEVDVWARPLLASRGEDVRVEQVQADGLTVQVVRYADGTTNLSRLLERYEQTAPPEEKPAEEAKPLDLSNVHLERATLNDGVIRLVDRRTAKPTELAINDLDLEVRDVQIGKPLKLELAAAVLAQAQNLKVQVTTAPLPTELVPVPESLSLQLAQVDLAPLAPFLAGSGLLGGRLQADFQAQLGAAVPGGRGETRLKGGFEADQLRFEDAQGGKALDVKLDTDVTGDVAKGDLRLDTLVLSAGPARLTGEGRIEGLFGDALRVDGFKLVGEGLDPQALAAYYPPLRKTLGDQVAGPVGLTVRGSGTAESQTLRAQVDLTPVRLRIPDQLNKAAGAPMQLTASVSGSASGGPLRFDVDLQGDGVDLRPGALLDKAPGERLAAELAGTYRPGKRGETFTVDVSRLKLGLKQDTLEGSARYAGGGKTTEFSLDVKAPRLDANALLLSDAEVAAAGGKVSTPSTDPDRFDGYRGDIRLAVGTLLYDGYELGDVRARMKMVDDRIAVEQFETRVFGGSVVANGSSIALGPLPERRPFVAKVKVANLDVGQALAAVTDKEVLTGRFTGDFDFTGTGYNMDALERTLAGALQGELVQGTFLGIDVIGSVVEPLTAAVPFPTKKLNLGDVTQLAADLPVGVTVQNGVAQLKKPISWTRPGQAQLQFDGGMQLDGTLQLDGRVSLDPALMKTLTGGRVVPPGPIPLDLKLTGPAWRPRVEGLDVRPAAESLVKLAAAGAAQQLLGKERTEQLQKAVGGSVEEAKAKAQQEAERRAAEERAKLEKQAKDKAAAEQRRLEEEAKKRLKGVFGR